MARYKLVKDEDLNTTGVIINDGTHPNLAEGTSIPNSTDNRHWVEYVEWEVSNDADAADTIDYMEMMRQERNGYLSAIDWRVIRNYRQVQNSETPTDDATAMGLVYTYMKDLADMPENNPGTDTKAEYEALTWPSEPA